MAAVIEEQDEDGVRLSCSPTPLIRRASVAVPDAVLNNSDRKGLHLVRVDNGSEASTTARARWGATQTSQSVLWGCRQATRCPAPMSTARPTRLRHRANPFCGRVTTRLTA